MLRPSIRLAAQLVSFRQYEFTIFNNGIHLAPGIPPSGRPVGVGTKWLGSQRRVKIEASRKTDLKDCVWIAQLLEHGLIRASLATPTPVQQRAFELLRVSPRL